MLISATNGPIDTAAVREACDRLAVQGCGGVPLPQLHRLARDVKRLCDQVEAQAEEVAMLRRLLADAGQALAGASDERARLMARTISRRLDAVAGAGP